MPAPLPQVWFNGALCAIEDAHVSILDRGFLFGDGVYELLPVYRGVPFRVDQHIARLQHSLRETGIPTPYDAQGWRNVIDTTINANGESDVTVYVQVTRGADTHRDHAFPRTQLEPTVLVYCAPLPQMSPHLRRDGVSAIVREDIRWGRCDIKSTSLLGNVLLRQQAVTHDAAETFLHDGQNIIEGSASSLFAVIDGQILTPPDGHEILPGTTRDLVLELAREAGLPARFAHIALDDFRRADEIWVCSSVREVLPVTRLDGVEVGNGRPGPRYREIDELFQAYKERLIREQAA
ncbi:MAG: D-amino acid aminotransferase [Gammaproteobacteria bacterium]|nr:D-amino acid aminotransferase [Gammaproteobacteria bacterium]